jgi:hypothetical protein
MGSGVEGPGQDTEDKAEDSEWDGESDGEMPCVERGEGDSSGIAGLRARFSRLASFTVGSGTGMSGGMSSNKIRRVA